MLVVTFVFLIVAVLPDGGMADEAQGEPLHTNKIISGAPLMRTERKAGIQDGVLIRSEGEVDTKLHSQLDSSVDENPVARDANGCPIVISSTILKRKSLHWTSASTRPAEACECVHPRACYGAEYNVPAYNDVPAKTVATCFVASNAIGNGHCRCEDEAERTGACVGNDALASTEDNYAAYLAAQATTTTATTTAA